VEAIPDGNESEAVVFPPGKTDDVQRRYSQGDLSAEDAWAELKALEESDRPSAEEIQTETEAVDAYQETERSEEGKSEPQD
jgi:hypothetical protein